MIDIAHRHNRHNHVVSIFHASAEMLRKAAAIVGGAAVFLVYSFPCIYHTCCHALDLLDALSVRVCVCVEQSTRAGLAAECL